MAESVQKAITLWQQRGTSDKTYNVQIIAVDGGKSYRVQSQYGRRGAVQREAGHTYVGSSLYEAESSYNALVSKKRSGGYDREINPPIVPAGSAVTSATVTANKKAAAESAKKEVSALHTFLAENSRGKKAEVTPTENGYIGGGLAKLFASFNAEGGAENLETEIETITVVEVSKPKGTGYYPQLLTEIDEETAQKLIKDPDWIAQQKG
jgi:hypothetical protein